ncbi:hypothetical protein [Hymenobacter sublimis]|uniref:STAS/SEC14 domain-containing protein n=2 Tax=Hymenobacter TaxID=89966 RepID=A0ABY4J9H8_9BACT|nr:hypothetical protein [Hymenobacter sublimis]UPL49081.1 hypothetical protein MWH26_18065 [Hymenobacter sublimis]
MTLYNSPDASLTYNSLLDTLHLSYNAAHLSGSFGEAYHRALEEMLAQNVDKLLVDLKRNAPPTDEADALLQPLTSILPGHLQRPLFIAAVVSEGQYQYQVGNSLASASLPPSQVEFNYFTSRRDATQWLSEN